MKIAVDLHIHTALSPCADDDMTPNNIVNMAWLKGLDAIAITDHNSCDNVEAVIQAAGGRMLVLPGMEIQTREDVHLLCYFSDAAVLKAFDRELSGHLVQLMNVPEVFGHQWIMDADDRIVGERNESLLNSVDWSIDEVTWEVVQRGGVIIPAHVDRSSYSIISNLGFIPQNLHYNMLEISHSLASSPSFYYDLKCIHSSDAHQLKDILERETYLEIDNMTLEGLITCLKR